MKFEVEQVSYHLKTNPFFVTKLIVALEQSHKIKKKETCKGIWTTLTNLVSRCEAVCSAWRQEVRHLITSGKLPR